MTSNLDKFQSDLDELILKGNDMYLSMLMRAKKDFYEKLLAKAKRQKNGEEEKRVRGMLKSASDFSESYQSWYSESLAVIKQVLPNRLEDFISHYEKPKGRKALEVGTYTMQDYLDGVRVTRGGEIIVDQTAAISQFEQQLSIVKSAKSRFKSSLFDILQMVQADLFDSEIDAARELLRHKFFRAAGAIAGVVVEKHLKHVCDNRLIKITKKHPTISDLNELLKANAVIDIPQWRYISMLADIRNACDHNKEKEPTAQQVADLIDGTDKILKTLA